MDITRKYLIAKVILAVVVTAFAVIIVLGHMYPQQMDTLGDKVFGPIFYGRVPQ